MASLEQLALAQNIRKAQKRYKANYEMSTATGMRVYGLVDV